ncbi:holo-ACP synthase [Micromonospora sp. WMMA1923]|uniref:holo-ACP synthase n=1 Tax=Micromonospora sp. WMMA1923 TaxID=3404125 RepID=UPI003B933559
MRLGVDLIAVDALDRLLGRRRLERFVFAAAELRLADTLGPARRTEFLAGRFVAKEAVLKVLGRGLFQGVRPSDIAVTRAPTGAPEVELRGSARAVARDCGIDQVSVSITHKHNLAIAVALAAAAGGPLP